MKEIKNMYTTNTQNNNTTSVTGFNTIDLTSKTANNTYFDAKKSRLFSYVGSKLKYKNHFDSLLSDLEKKTTKYILKHLQEVLLLYLII